MEPVSFNKALAKMAALCSKSEKCAHDAEQKLLMWGVSNEDSVKIIARLREEKYIDDLRFATYFVRDKYRFNKWGRVKIVYALRMKKIASETIREAVAVIDEDDYIKTARELIDSKNRSIRGCDVYTRNVKLFRFLSGRGFEPEIISDLLKSL
jgi:regulatory protein